MLCSSNAQINWPDRSTLSAEWAHQVWRKSKHVWASNHWFEADRFTATKCDGSSTHSKWFASPSSSSLLSSYVVCVFCSSTHSKWRPAPGKDEGRDSLLATNSQRAISTIDSNTTSMVHKHLSLWAVFMSLMGSKSFSCGEIAQQFRPKYIWINFESIESSLLKEKLVQTSE